MKHPSSHRASAVLAATLGLPALVLAQTQPTQQELLDRLSRLESEVQALRANQPTTPPPADPTTVAATQSAVRNDASTRSALSGTAGYDNGFYIRSADGNFSLTPIVAVQLRYEVNNANDRVGGEDGWQHGFEIRRAQLRFRGHAFTPKLTYLVYPAFNRANGNAYLEEALINYQLTDEVKLTLGQFKSTVSREFELQSWNGVVLEESISSLFVGGGVVGYIQGAQLTWGGTKDNPLQARIAFTDGDGSQNTNFQQDAGTPDNRSDWGAYARAEYKFFGDWKDAAHMNARPGQSDFLLVGAGLSADGGSGGSSYIALVDAMYQHNSGLSALAAFYGRFDNADSTSDYGLTLQAGYALTGNWELYARGAFVFFDTATDISEYTLGVNYYFGENGKFQNRAKLSFDIGYLPEGSPSNLTGQDILQGTGDQFYARLQLQLVI